VRHSIEKAAARLVGLWIGVQLTNDVAHRPCVCRIFCLPELSEVRSLEGFVGVQHRLLHLEELQAARDIERYDLFNVGTNSREWEELE
jgi:hypothetical protein